MISKLNWLKNWLANHAPEIDAIKATTIQPFHWLHTGYSQIPIGSKYYFRAAQHNILPKARLVINH